MGEIKDGKRSETVQDQVWESKMKSIAGWKSSFKQ